MGIPIYLPEKWILRYCMFGFSIDGISLTSICSVLFVFILYHIFLFLSNLHISCLFLSYLLFVLHNLFLSLHSAYFLSRSKNLRFFQCFFPQWTWANRLHQPFFQRSVAHCRPHSIYVKNTFRLFTQLCMRPTITNQLRS